MIQDALFDAEPLSTPDNNRFINEGIKYTGSKLKLLKPIFELANEIKFKTVLDGFSGTTRVSRMFAAAGCDVFTNDLAPWSAEIARAYLCSDYKNVNHYGDLISHLNSLPPIEGWFTKNYGNYDKAPSPVREDGKKAVWQYHNTTKLDAIRQEIDSLNLSQVDKSIALTSLIHALDKVDSTLGHHAAYLRNWSPRSFNSMKLEVPCLIPLTGKHEITSLDIFERLDGLDQEIDLMYFDPPYGSNNEKMPPSRVRYSSYYHLWKTITLNDKPDIFGAANRREDSRDKLSYSPFEDYRRSESGRFVAIEAIEKMVKKANCKYLMLSYSSGGRATFDELKELLNSAGKLLKVVEIEYKRNVMAKMRSTNKWVDLEPRPNIEYLFLLRKN